METIAESVCSRPRSRGDDLGARVNLALAAGPPPLARGRRIRTRLGDDRVRVELDFEVPCFYADPERTAPVRHVDLPFRVVGTLTEEESAHRVSGLSVTSEGVEFHINGRGPIRYDPDGWHWP